jgi:signal peptidase I
MNKKTIPKKIIKDVLIVAFGVLIMWTGVQAVFGTQNPFYVVASGSMVPVLEKNDVIIVQGNEPFEGIQKGDVIVFDRPSDHDKVIVHRVASIINDDPKTLRTQGDANSASIPGTDFPITEEEYLGKVVYAIPQIGYVTEFLKPPLNYVLMSVIVGIMVIKQITNKKNKN